MRSLPSNEKNQTVCTSQTHTVLTKSSERERGTPTSTSWNALECRLPGQKALYCRAQRRVQAEGGARRGAARSGRAHSCTDRRAAHNSPCSSTEMLASFQFTYILTPIAARPVSSRRRRVFSCAENFGHKFHFSAPITVFGFLCLQCLNQITLMKLAAQTFHLQYMIHAGNI